MKLCGGRPVPASSGATTRHRHLRGCHRQANAALYPVVIVRLRWHQPTMDYVTRRTAQEISQRDIVRCLTRFVARKVSRALLTDHAARHVAAAPAAAPIAA